MISRSGGKICIAARKESVKTALHSTRIPGCRRNVPRGAPQVRPWFYHALSEKHAATGVILLLPAVAIAFRLPTHAAKTSEQLS